jgi:hypothetical protein
MVIEWFDFATTKGEERPYPRQHGGAGESLASAKMNKP